MNRRTKVYARMQNERWAALGMMLFWYTQGRVKHSKEWVAEHRRKLTRIKWLRKVVDTHKLGV